MNLPKQLPNIVYESDCIEHGVLRTSIPIETDFWYDVCPLCNRELKMFPIGRALKSTDLIFTESTWSMSDKKRKNTRRKLHKRIFVEPPTLDNWSRFYWIADNLCGR